MTHQLPTIPFRLSIEKFDALMQILNDNLQNPDAADIASDLHSQTQSPSDKKEEFTNEKLMNIQADITYMKVIPHLKL